MTSKVKDRVGFRDTGRRKEKRRGDLCETSEKKTGFFVSTKRILSTAQCPKKGCWNL